MEIQTWSQATRLSTLYVLGSLCSHEADEGRKKSLEKCESLYPNYSWKKKGVYTSAPSEYRQSGTSAMAAPQRTKTVYTQGPGTHYCARILSVGTWQKGVLISVSSEYRGREPYVGTKF